MAAFRKLDPSAKLAWVRALRSGVYKQGTGYLVQTIAGEEYHCCLGVKAEIEPWMIKNSGWFKNTRGGRSCGFTVLEADDVCKSAQMVLIQMNDKGVGFPAIADWIEDNL